MAAAIPAAIGVGGSIIGGIQGKGAAKKQEKLAQQQMAMLQPLIQQQLQGLQFAQQQGQQLFPQATNALNTVFNTATGTFEPLMKDYRQMLADATTSQGKFNAEGDALIGKGQGMLDAGNAGMIGALSGLSDLQQAYRPFINEGASAIEKFLPKGAVLNRLLAGQFGDINQGFKSASQNIESFAPRGGGRISSLANADVNRQQQLTKARSEGTMGYGQMALNNFFQGAEGTRNILGNKAQIAQGQGQLGLGTIGAGQQSKQQGIADFGAKSNVGLQQLQSALQALGLAGGAAGNLGQLAGSSLNLGAQGGGNIFDMVNQQQNRAYGSAPAQNNSKGLGGFLVDMFNTPGAKDWLGGLFKGGKGPSTMPSQKY
jgi:hypothetical protein